MRLIMKYLAAVAVHTAASINMVLAAPIQPRDPQRGMSWMGAGLGPGAGGAYMRTYLKNYEADTGIIAGGLADDLGLVDLLMGPPKPHRRSPDPQLAAAANTLASLFHAGYEIVNAESHAHDYTDPDKFRPYVPKGFSHVDEDALEEMREGVEDIHDKRDAPDTSASLAGPASSPAADSDGRDADSKKLSKRHSKPWSTDDKPGWWTGDDTGRFNNVLTPSWLPFAKGDLDREYDFQEDGGGHPDGVDINPLMEGAASFWPTMLIHNEAMRMAKEEQAKKDQLQKAILRYHEMNYKMQHKAEKAREAMDARKAEEATTAVKGQSAQ